MGVHFSIIFYWKRRDCYEDYADWSQSAVTKYYDYAKPAGIDLKDYLLKVVDGLKLSIKQKDALYYLNGWAESKLSEAP